MQCSSEQVFIQCLDYMYSSSISLNHLNAVHVLQVAQVLQIDPLVQACEEFLAQSVDNSSFVERYFVSLKYKLYSLQDKVLEFVQTNITGIIERAELLGLSPQDFKLFITQGKMATLKQEMKFSLILSWAGINVHDRDKYLLHLFNHVAWAASVDELLLQISCTQNIFTTNEFCLFQLLHSLVMCSGHQLGPFTSAYPRLYSVYSHMLDDLVQPKVFSVPSHFTLDVGHSSVSIKCAMDSQKVKPKLIEIGVNTDSCLESSDNMDEEINEETIKTATEKSEEKPIAIVNDTTTLEKVNVDNSSASTKHRRKSLPRKIPLEKPEKVQKKSVKRQSKRSTGKDLKVKVVKVGKVNNNSKKSKTVNVEITKESESVNDDQNHKKIPEEVNEATTDVLEEEKDEHSLEFILNKFAEEDDNDDDDEDTELDDSEIGEGENAQENDMEEKTLTIDTAQSNEKKKDKVKAPVNMNSKNRRRGRPMSAKSYRKEEMVLKERVKVDKAKGNRRKLECSYEDCKFMSKTEDGIEKHIERVHMLDVELSCHKCEYTTKEMKSLCFHIKSHYSSLPYHCEVEGCTYTFMRVGLFIRHQMTHLNLKPFKCDLCGKQFALYNQLSCHKKLHKGKLLLF